MGWVGRGREERGVEGHGGEGRRAVRRQSKAGRAGVG